MKRKPPKLINFLRSPRTFWAAWMFIRKLTTYWATVWADSASGVPSSGQPMQTARKSKAAEELQKNKKGCTVTQSYKKREEKGWSVTQTHTVTQTQIDNTWDANLQKSDKKQAKNWELMTCNCTHRCRLTIPGSQICFVSAHTQTETKKTHTQTNKHSNTHTQ